MCAVNEKSRRVFDTHICSYCMEVGLYVPQECWAGHGSSGQDVEQCNDETNNNIIDEDSIHLLDEGKSLELIQFDPIGENESTYMHGMLATVF